MIQNNSGASNRIRHAARMLDEFIALDSFHQFDRWLSQRMKQEKKFGKNDRRWYSDMLFAAMRHALCACTLAQRGKTASANQLIECAHSLNSWNDIRSVIKSISSEEFLRHAADIDQSSNELLSIKESLYAYGIKGKMLWHSIPGWMSHYIEERASLSAWDAAALETFLSQHDTRPPLWVRLNRLNEDALITRSLTESGFSVQQFDNAFQLKGQSSLYNTEPYTNGSLEIQDYASQMIGRACDVHPGMYVWDACAGGGGKTLQIATALEGKGAVYASDIRSYKLEETKLRARRAGFSNVRTLEWNGENLPVFPKEISSRGGFHRVLVDAPCSSSGTWRRNPDGKYRLTKNEFDELNALQLKIIAQASQCVRPQGLLVYATCSFVCAENESVVSAFLKDHPDYTLESSQIHGSPLCDADTTFTAVMKRKDS